MSQRSLLSRSMGRVKLTKRGEAALATAFLSALIIVMAFCGWLEAL